MSAKWPRSKSSDTLSYLVGVEGVDRKVNRHSIDMSDWLTPYSPPITCAVIYI